MLPDLMKSNEILTPRAPKPEEGGEQSPEATKELRSSCDTCLRLKKKCDRSKPFCSSCVRKGYNCCYTEKRKRGRKPLNMKKKPCNSMTPKRTIGFTAPTLEGFSFQERSFLGLFQKFFRTLCPAAVDTDHYSRILSAQPRSPAAEGEGLGAPLPPPPGRQADLVGLWSAVAVGALFAGNRRDLGTYVARVQRAAAAGGLAGPDGGAVCGGGGGGGGLAEARARLPLALMHNLLGQRAQAYDALDLGRRLLCVEAERRGVDPAAAAGGGGGGEVAALSASVMALFPLLADGRPEKFIELFLGLVEQGGQSFLGAPQQAHAWRAMNIFYSVYFAYLKMPFVLGEGQEHNLEALVRTCYHNLSVAEAEMAKHSEDYSPASLFCVQDKLFLLEFTCLGRVSEALNRCKTGLLPLLILHPHLLHVSYIRIKVCLLLYASWLAGDQDAYETFGAIWNSQALTTADCHPFPLYGEYNPAIQCNHYYCKMMQPKFQLAATMTQGLFPDGSDLEEIPLSGL